MRRKQVSPESLKSVSYQPDGGVLEVEFKNGRIYRYLRVPRQVYHGLLKAPSHGAYFNERIKSDFTYCQVAGRSCSLQER